MTVTLRLNGFGEEVARFESSTPPNNGDYFDVKRKNGHGHSPMRYKVVNRVFEVISARKKPNDKEPECSLAGVVCIVVPGA